MTVLDYRSAPPADPDAEKTAGHWLAWAVYLAMSWTWCIGMFLPVLLVRDYGIWGWVVFAVPNVLGAAAMGWIIRSREMSEEIVVAHRVAMLTFSTVTMAFQFFFIAWILHETPFEIFLIPAFALAWLAIIVPKASWMRIALTSAVVTLLVSITCAAVVVDDLRGFLRWRTTGLSPFTDLIGLVPISLFGFLLCPYLDLTFHRSRQQSGPYSRLSFGFGFGVIFTAVITFTLVYALHPGDWNIERIGEPASLALVLYFTAQIAFTSAAHTCELRALQRAGGWGAAVMLAAALAVGIACYAGSDVLFSWLPRWPSNRRGEAMYRAFIGFFGLVFPTYVWLCMVGSATRAPTRRAVVVFLVTVALAAPMFWLAIIQRQMVWLLPGLSVVLLARLFVPRPFKFTG